MELLAFTHIAMYHETPHGQSGYTLDSPSSNVLRRLDRRWLGLTTTALSLAFIMAAPGAMAMVRLGDRGVEVSTLQTSLQRAGYAVGVVDGIFGTATQNALIQFQAAHGLIADGIAGTATLAKLADVNNASTATTASTSTTASTTTPSELSTGASGPIVTELQTKLQQLGFFPSSVAISDFYGPVTTDAVRRFQQANGLGSDGIAGPATRARLFGANPVSQQAAQAQQSTNTSVTASATVTNPQILRFGQRNTAVVTLQNRLKELAYLPANLTSTGYFGDLTLNAVKAFQTKNELLADGLVGPQTLNILNSSTAIAFTTPTPAPEQTVSNPPTGGATNPPAVGGTVAIAPGKTITVRTNGGLLNVRSAPNTNSSTIKGTLANGTSVEATGAQTAEWVEIVNGWIHKDYVEIPQ